MRVLVTGGAGFLGSHLCERLLQDGHSVICLDNLLTGKKENVDHLVKSPNFRFIEADVTKPIDVDGELYAVFHLASVASPVFYHRYPIQTLKSGALGSHNTLGLAKAKKCLYFLASTSEGYGNPQVHPQTESYWGHVNPVGPRGAYDESKRFAEAITMAYHRVHRVDTRIARIFNTYGPRMALDDGRAIPSFMSQAVRNEPITVHGEGTQTRSFCYVSDLIDGFLLLLKADYHEPVNLGNPSEITIRQMAEEIIRLSGSKSRITSVARPVDDPERRKPDITLAKELTGWEPKVALKEGLTQTLNWFRQKISVAVK